MEAYARVILKENGLDPDKDVTLLANGVYAQAYASLETGQVAATIIHQPYVALAEKEGKGKLLAKGYEYLPSFHTGVLVASDKFIAEHPEELRQIIKAYYKSWTYAKENLSETVEFGAKYVEIDKDVLRAALESELEIWANEPKVDTGAINDTQDTQIELGFQTEKYDVTPFINESFLP
jgi:NitT/TauT family transport system substrate-binding protein